MPQDGSNLPKTHFMAKAVGDGWGHFILMLTNAEHARERLHAADSRCYTSAAVDTQHGKLLVMGGVALYLDVDKC